MSSLLFCSTYSDSYDHGSLEAERAYRAAFRAGAKEVMEQAAVEALFACEEARQERRKVRQQAEIIITSAELFDDPSFNEDETPEIGRAHV